jgi:hypothetical protein
MNGLSPGGGGRMTKEDTRLRQRSLYFMEDPKRWPWYPFLPLVRRGSGEDGGTPQAA